MERKSRMETAKLIMAATLPAYRCDDDGKDGRKEVYENVRKEVERIYLEAWKKGISVPFFDGKGNTFLVNPDGSEDLVLLDLHSRTYNIIRRTAVPGRTWWAMK